MLWNIFKNLFFFRTGTSSMKAALAELLPGRYIAAHSQPFVIFLTFTFFFLIPALEVHGHSHFPIFFLSLSLSLSSSLLFTLFSPSEKCLCCCYHFFLPSLSFKEVFCFLLTFSSSSSIQRRFCFTLTMSSFSSNQKSFCTFYFSSVSSIQRSYFLSLSLFIPSLPLREGFHFLFFFHSEKCSFHFHFSSFSSI